MGSISEDGYDAFCFVLLQDAFSKDGEELSGAPHSILTILASERPNLFHQYSEFTTQKSGLLWMWLSSCGATGDSSIGGNGSHVFSGASDGRSSKYRV